ncbi:MAG: T9SS type A sorting domain-containing protein [Sphingobacteriaceae bacterium]|nr:MAG: T9SS type A sorting domain-containing protein [Sphingobacteriaceae bacterium]
MKKKLLICIVFFTLMLANKVSWAITYTWTGATSTAWNLAANWSSSGGTFPGAGAGDIVNIGVSGAALSRFPVITVTPANSIASITIGTIGGTSPSLTVTGVTLTVTGAITYTTSNIFTATLAGTGTINAASLNAITTSTANSNNTCTLTASITTLTLSGNLALTTTFRSSGSRKHNMTVDFTGTTLSLAGIQTTNPNAANISTFSIGNNKTLNFTGGVAAQLATLSATGTNTITLGTGLTIGYTGNVAQTVYTNLAIPKSSLASGISYTNLTLSGSGIKTTNGTSANNLNVSGSFTNSLANDASNRPDFTTNSTTVVFNGAAQAISVGGGLGTTFRNVTLSGTGIKTASSGTMNITGSFTNSLANDASNRPDFTTNSGTVVFNGSGAQAISVGGGLGTTFRNVTFSGTGIKTVSSGIMNITGNFTNSLANDVSNYVDFTTNSTPLSFTGTTQSLAGGSGTGTNFKTVTFSGGGTKTIISGIIKVISSGVLTLSGSSTLAAGGFLTLKSDANSSATVAAIPAGSSITGNVNVERYLSGDQSYSRGYRLISSPVSVSSGTLLWPNLTYIHSKMYTTGTGGATNGFDAAGTGPTMYLYRENMAPNFSSFISGNNRAVSKINNGTAYNFNVDGDAGTFNIPAGNGLLLFFRGDRATTVNPTNTSTIAKPTTLTATGYLNQGNITVKHWTTGTNGLLYTPGSPVSVRGFNLLGNPYASSIDWDLMTGQTNIGTTIWVYNPTLKVFSTYIQGNGGVGTNTNGGNVADIIPSGQGFYVKSTAASPSVTFTESHKVNTQVAAANIMLAAAPPTTDLKYIRVKLTQDADNKDDALIFFKPGTSADYTVDEDADYLRGNNLVAISTRVNNRAALAINQMPLPAYKDNINLNVIVPANGNYQISVPETHDMPANYDVWIKDWLKKDSVNIKTTPTYSFDAVATDSTTFKRRFSIVITTDPGSAYYLGEFKGSRQGGAVQLTWKTGNEGSTTQFTIQRSNDDGLTYTDLGSFKSNSSGSYTFTDNSPLFFAENLYRLKHVDVSGTIAYSGTVPVAFGIYGDVVQNVIRAYPNPVTTAVKLLVAERRDKNSKAEKYSDYTITISNNQGIAVSSINTSQPDTWEGDVSKLAPGVYFINVYNNYTKTLVGNSKFVKL